jgi:hypothetical protein
MPPHPFHNLRYPSPDGHGANLSILEQREIEQKLECSAIYVGDELRHEGDEEGNAGNRENAKKQTENTDKENHSSKPSKPTKRQTPEHHTS